MIDTTDIHLIAAQLAAALIGKHEASQVDATGAVDIYLKVLEALEHKAPRGRPRRPPIEISDAAVEAARRPPRRVIR
jgi:hypothetical protein